MFVEDCGDQRVSERSEEGPRVHQRPASLTFTVTLENLREEDGGLYRCGIDVLSTFDPIFDVEVSVIPGEHLPPSLQHQAGHPDPQEGSGTERLGQDDREGVGRWAWLWVVSWAHVCLHTCTSLSVSGATLELHVDTVKVGIFLLHGLAGIPLWGPGCLLSSQGHVHSQGARVTFWPVQSPAYGGRTLTGSTAYRLALTPGP